VGDTLHDQNVSEVTNSDVLPFLPAGSAAGSSAGISFTHGPSLGFFASGATRCTDQGEIWHRGADRSLNRLRGGGLRPPKLKKNSNFINIIAPKGRVPCTIFIKFT